MCLLEYSYTGLSINKVRTRKEEVNRVTGKRCFTVWKNVHRHKVFSDDEGTPFKLEEGCYPSEKRMQKDLGSGLQLES